MSDHSSAAQQVQIDLAERSYGIVIGSGLLGHSQTYQGLPRAHSALIVTNTTVAPLYASALSTAATAKPCCMRSAAASSAT